MESKNRCWMDSVPSHVLEVIMIFATDKLSDILKYARIEKKWLILINSLTIFRFTTFTYEGEPNFAWNNQSDEVRRNSVPLQLLRNVHIFVTKNIPAKGICVPVQFKNLIRLRISSVFYNRLSIYFPFQPMIARSNVQCLTCFKQSLQIAEDCYPPVFGKACLKISRTSFHNWHALEECVFNNIRLEESVVFMLSKMPKLRSVSITDCEPTCTIIAGLGAISTLQFLRLKRIHLQCDNGSFALHEMRYEHFTRNMSLFPALTHLYTNEVNDFSVSDQSSEYIGLLLQSNSVKVLKCVKKFQINNSSYPRLEILIIDNMRKVTINFLQQCSKLSLIIIKYDPQTEKLWHSQSLMKRVAEIIRFHDPFPVPDRFNYFIITKLDIDNPEQKPWVFWKSLYKYQNKES